MRRENDCARESRWRFACTSRALATVAVAVAVTVGCHQKVTYTPPEVYPVTGKVIAPAGIPLAKATIEFRPENLEHMARGRVAEDGSFSLSVAFHDKLIPGATPGPHKVNVQVSGLGFGGSDKVYTVDGTYTIEPKENNFTITLNE